jgi:hypothetical protein
MPDAPPRIAARIEFAHAFVAVTLIVEALVIWPGQRVSATLWILGALAILFVVLRRISTTLTDEGVSQLTWRGRVDLQWRDIQSIERAAKTVTVTGAGGSVVLPIESYYDSAAALRFLDAHLPAHLR